MSLGLTVLICICSVGILAGRIYEILRLTDIETGFLITEGIALNPVLLVLFAVITVCCGMIIFGSEKDDAPFFSKSSGIFADIAGAAFIVYGIMAVSQSRVAVFMIAGGIALIITGLTGLGSKPKDIAVIVLLTVFAAGMCLDVIIFDVYSVYYTEFMHRVLAYSSIIMVILAVLKNVYAPSGWSEMLLYISGMLCFAFSGMLSIAELICSFAVWQGFSVVIIRNIALALFGVYALDNALSVLPKEKKVQGKREDYPSRRRERKKEISYDIKTEEKYSSSEFAAAFFAVENPAEEKSADISAEVKDKRIFKGSRQPSSKTEKIVYRKPRD